MWYSAIGCLVTLALSLLVVPLLAVAQPARKIPKIGLLFASSATQNARNVEAFTQGLRALGYIEGQHIAIEQRYADGSLERLPALAAKQATSTIPIVMVAVDYDPIALGYIAGLPRPGGQITGLFLQQIEFTGKCLELLKEALPQVTRVAVLLDAISADQFRAAEGVARILGLQLHSLDLRQPPAYDYASALEAAAREGAEALLVLRSPLFNRDRDRIIALAAQHRWPIMSGTMGLPKAGALMAYGADYVDMTRRAAAYVAKILQGATAADLPVEQPTKFTLIINLRTAKALGITIPPPHLVLADEVIQ